MRRTRGRRCPAPSWLDAAYSLRTHCPPFFFSYCGAISRPCIADHYVDRRECKGPQCLGRKNEQEIMPRKAARRPRPSASVGASPSSMPAIAACRTPLPLKKRTQQIFAKDNLPEETPLRGRNLDFLPKPLSTSPSRSPRKHVSLLSAPLPCSVQVGRASISSAMSA